MADTPTAAGMASWRAFLEAHARVTAILEQELQRKHGLALAWYDVLVQLHEARRGRLRMSELAAAVLLSKSGLTRLADRMVEVRLIEREADPDDRRGVLVSLTGTGLARLREAAPTHLRGIQEHFAGMLSESEATVLGGLLSRVG